MTRSTSRSHIERIKRMDCVLCGATGPSDAHHIREGQGIGQRASDYLAIPLCKSCHQGENGVHGDKTLQKVYKMEELDLLAETIEKLMQGQ